MGMGMDRGMVWVSVPTDRPTEYTEYKARTRRGSSSSSKNKNKNTRSSSNDNVNVDDVQIQ